MVDAMLVGRADPAHTNLPAMLLFQLLATAAFVLFCIAFFRALKRNPKATLALVAIAIGYVFGFGHLVSAVGAFGALVSGLVLLSAFRVVLGYEPPPRSYRPEVPAGPSAAAQLDERIREDHKGYVEREARWERERIQSEQAERQRREFEASDRQRFS